MCHLRFSIHIMISWLTTFWFLKTDVYLLHLKKLKVYILLAFFSFYKSRTSILSHQLINYHLRKILTKHFIIYTSLGCFEKLWNLSFTHCFGTLYQLYEWNRKTENGKTYEGVIFVGTYLKIGHKYFFSYF